MERLSPAVFYLEFLLYLSIIPYREVRGMNHKGTKDTKEELLIYKISQSFLNSRIVETGIHPVSKFTHQSTNRVN